MLSSNSFTKALLVSAFAAYATATTIDTGDINSKWNKVGSGSLTAPAAGDPEDEKTAYAVDNNIKSTYAKKDTLLGANGRYKLDTLVSDLNTELGNYVTKTVYTDIKSKIEDVDTNALRLSDIGEDAINIFKTGYGEIKKAVQAHSALATIADLEKIKEVGKTAF